MMLLISEYHILVIKVINLRSDTQHYHLIAEKKKPLSSLAHDPVLIYHFTFPTGLVDPFCLFHLNLFRCLFFIGALIQTL